MKTILLILVMSLTFNPVNFNSKAAVAEKLKSLPRYSNGYLVHGTLEILFTSEAYKCHGYKAVSNYTDYSCSLCKKTYYSQRFEDVEGEVYTIYSNSECSVSSTKYHDHLDLSEVGICVCKDVFVK